MEMSTMSIIFVKLFLLGRFKAGDFGRAGIGLCYKTSGIRRFWVYTLKAIVLF
jgi:hypothetical protein